ncbi:MAG: hypothetical protein K0Q60_1810 [Microvirga sp.]|nr:hypothetical protein [Microvirga sp.]
MAAKDILAFIEDLLRKFENRGIDIKAFEKDFDEGTLYATDILSKLQDADIDLDSINVKFLIPELLFDLAQNAEQAGHPWVCAELLYQSAVMSEAAIEWWERNRSALTISEIRQHHQWGPLIEYLAEGQPITDEIRLLIIEMLSGKIKRAAGGSRSIKPYIIAGRMVADVEQLERQGWPTEAAVKEVATNYKVSDRTVYRALELDDFRGLRMTD